MLALHFAFKGDSAERRCNSRFNLDCGERKREAPGGFEPPMSDLQSDALATWPRRLIGATVQGDWRETMTFIRLNWTRS